MNNMIARILRHLANLGGFYALSLFWIYSYTDLVESVRPPYNLTVYKVGILHVTLIWEAETDDDALFFEMTYELLDHTIGPFRVNRGVDASQRELTLDCLQPLSYYSAYMVTVDTRAMRSNRSNMVVFSTASAETAETVHYTPHPGEILVASLVLIAWAVAIIVFLKRWASIRILQPMEPRYRHNPKNLENVKVVKRAQDSVIYKNYGRKLSVTIVEREKKRLQRMHTIATLPTIEMEHVVTEM